jgi:hypothetical protein
MSGLQQLHCIVHPHDHDVLSGRGNFVNYHVGNEHFRSLVRKHKMAYVACPKPEKANFSKLIIGEIQGRSPPGRFLKQDHKTKLWYDIGAKKAMDKTRQALREGAPDIMKELTRDEDDSGVDESDHQSAQVAPQRAPAPRVRESVSVSTYCIPGRNRPLRKCFLYSITKDFFKMEQIAIVNMRLLLMLILPC